MNLLSLERVCKRFGSGPLLVDVSFGLEHDEKMGVIGRNGCGKTTLLRMIAGSEPVDGGRIVLANGKRVAYIAQNPVFAAGQTVLDTVFDQSSEEMRRLHDYEAAIHELDATGGTSERWLTRVAELSHQLDLTGGWSLEANAKAVLNRLGVNETTAPIETLSGGQRKRVALARGLIMRPDLLILDEPTNHLDADTIAWLEEYLAGYVGALLLVTHDRYFLDRVTNRMLEIEDGGVQRFEGNYTYYLEKKEEQAILREGEARKRENLVRRELAWLRQGAKARSTKQKAHVERARAVVDAPRAGPERTLELAAASSRLGNKILEIHDLGKAYGERTLIRDFSYNLTRGDRIGIIGPNGSGKTTLLDIIAGRVTADTGHIEIGSTAVLGYFEQEPATRRVAGDGAPRAQDADAETRVIDYIKAVAEQVPTADGGVISASQMLERFLFPGAAQFTPLGRLSGGERRRLALLRLLMRAPNVLLLDEPTNDFDIATLIALEAWLESFDGCLIVASHDRAFLDRTVDRLFRFEPGGKLRGFPGSYTTYLEIIAQEQADEAARATADAARTATPRHDRAANARQDGRAGTAATPASAIPQPNQGSRATGGSSGSGINTLCVKPRKLTFKERRELDELEARIAAAEARKAEIEAALAAPSGDFNATGALGSELQTLESQLERDMIRWAELAERAEG